MKILRDIEHKEHLLIVELKILLKMAGVTLSKPLLEAMLMQC